MYEQIVKPQKVVIPQAPCNDGKDHFPNLPVTYEEYGSAKTQDGHDKPVVVILPFFLGTAHAAGYTKMDEHKKLVGPGYWDAVIGAGAPFNTDTHRVISLGPLIDRSFGPMTQDPATKKPYGGKFPNFSFADYAAIQYQALQQLGVRHIDVLVGASMGSLQAWHLAAHDMTFVSRMVVVVPGGLTLGDKTRVLARQWVEQLEQDPAWLKGDYYAQTKDHWRTHALAKVLGEFWYRCQFPLNHSVLYDMDDVEWLEIAKGFAPLVPAELKSLDEVLAGLDANAPAVKRYRAQVSALLGATDHNVLLWQLRTILTYAPLSVMRQSNKADFALLGSGDRTDTVPFRSTLGSVLMLATETDDLLEVGRVDEAMTAAGLLGARLFKLSLADSSPHGAGLVGAGVAPLADRIRHFLTQGVPVAPVVPVAKL